jgi:hypothetical protein
MFGPSLKSVPGCLVSIVPMLIGVPVAGAPFLGPHLDVSTEPPDELEPLEPLELPELGAELAPPLLELLLLPQAASSATTISAASAQPTRGRDRVRWFLKLVLLLEVLIGEPAGDRLGIRSGGVVVV